MYITAEFLFVLRKKNAFTVKQNFKKHSHNKDKHSKVNSRANFSLVLEGFTSYKKPNIISHHCIVPATLISPLHWLYVLMKPFTMFFTEITQIILKKSR